MLYNNSHYQSLLGNDMQAENYLTVSKLSVSYGKKNNKINVVNGLNLSLEKGEIGCFLGYSGCGKTTALRAIAGLEETEQGDIYLDNIHLTTNSNHILPPAKRGMGMVFQDYALFAHLSVADNIAFGLHKWAKDKRQQRVAEMLELVELSKHADKKPSQLSGGQQQRVALARALAPEPKLLLLDEPFSNLDIILREALASNVRDILKRTDTTAILVTHDQNEAFALADKVGVMNEGKLVQWATPSELYHQPSTPFVADFIGEGAIITATSDNGNLKTPLGEITLNNKNFIDNQAVKVLIRPDNIVYDKNSEIQAEVIGRAFRGANYLYHLRLADEQKIYSLISSEYHYEIGSKIAIMADLEKAVIFTS
ncbi:MAG: ABC transporter ATP-binding protein [Moraxellaceae bacterium]|nr:ABC transporter ATP-binding protein [Moraxellaceae bacterium]